MEDEPRARNPGARPRPRKPTFAERRERRAAVEDVAEVLDAAARFLEARPRAVAEVERKLNGMGYRPSLVSEVVERLLNLGYLDDEAFARAWVESRDRARPRGEYALRRELQGKGVAPDVIAAALEDRAGPAATVDGSDDRSAEGADHDAAVRLLERRGSSLLREPDLRRRRAKAYALLARNGFAPDVCAAVAARWLAGEDPDAQS